MAQNGRNLIRMAVQTEATPRFPCQCCGFLTLRDPATASYEVCPVCLWEDDPAQNEDPQYAGGANRVSLVTARDNYIRFGACEPNLRNNVRPPVIDEVPHRTLSQGREDGNKATILRGVKTILLGVIRAMLSGRITPLEGCSAVASVAWPIDDPALEQNLRTFQAVAGEAGEFPTGEVRQLWSPEALAREDAKAADYSRRIAESVRRACIELEARLKAELERR